MVTIIIPVFNAEKYLKRCVDSVLKQTYQNIEIILVEDCSTDLSYSICKEFSMQESKIRLFKNDENMGALLTRGVGRSHARGEYIWHIDADDYIPPFAVEVLMDSITVGNSDMCLFAAIQINGRKQECYNKLFSSPQLYDTNREVLFDILFTGTKLNNLCLKFYKASLDQNFRPQQYGYTNSGEDLLYSLELIDKAKRIYYIPQELYFYCINNESITSTTDFDERQIDTYRKTKQALENYMVCWDAINHKEQLYLRNLDSCFFLLNIMLNYKKIKKEYIKILSTDDYLFRIPYKNAIQNCKGRQKLLLFFLYHKIYGLLSFYSCARKIINMVMKYAK